MYTVSSGAVINASDVNQLVLVMQQGSGGTEIGKYFFESGTQSGWSMGCWISTLSRITVPVSVTVDTSTVLAGISGVGAGNISSAGFFVSGGATGNSATARAGGNYTVQY